MYPLLPIQIFFGLMIVAIGAWVAAIITALGATATIFGIPAGILIAIAAGGAFGAAFWGAGENLKSQCRSAKTLLEQKMSENTAYPNGAWPVATL